MFNIYSQSLAHHQDFLLILHVQKIKGESIREQYIANFFTLLREGQIQERI